MTSAIGESSLFDLMRREVNEVREQASDAMMRGQCSDYAAYRENVGKINSCDKILDYVDELERRFLEQ